MTELPKWAQRVLGRSGAQEIERAIIAAEATTSGEIVPVLVRCSSTIGHVPLATILIIAVCVFLLDLPAHLTGLGGPHLAWVALCWLFSILAALGLARLQVVQRLLTPRADQIAQVEARAQLEFYELNLRETRGRTGILLFVSAMERRAVVLADRAIAQTLDPHTWREVVDLMVQGAKKDDLAAGFSQAIHRCGEILAPGFPIADDDQNELRNRLVVRE